MESLLLGFLLCCPLVALSREVNNGRHGFVLLKCRDNVYQTADPVLKILLFCFGVDGQPMIPRF
jgi:hypothetical protein